MRAILGLVLALLLTGCGSSDGGRADDRGGDPGGTPSATTESTYAPGQRVPFDVVALVNGSNARGLKASYDPIVLANAAEVERFARRFQGELSDRIVEAADGAEVGSDETLVAGVIDVSCESPHDVEVVRNFTGLELRTTPVLSRRQCLVPITTVALVVVPSAAL